MATTDLDFIMEEKQPAKTEALLTLLNVGTSEAPDWAPLGIRVTSSNTEMDWQKEEVVDIIGNVYANIKKPIITQNFDAWTVNGGDRAQQRLWNLGIRKQDTSALQAQDILRVHFYAGSEEAPFAERYNSSTILINSFGGEGGGNLAMPITITYGGTRTTGTAKSANGKITFTPDTTTT